MKLYLAGADSPRPITSAVAGSLAADATSTPYMLTSYWYSRLQAGDKTNGQWRAMYNTIDAEWVIDSGLFTMMFGAGRGRKYTLDELKDYTVKYFRYLHEINYRHLAVEMDVHKVLGLSGLAELRKYIEDNWPLDRTIYVWHEEEGIDGLMKLADRYPYIALSVPELRIIAKNRKIDLESIILNLLNVVVSHRAKQDKARPAVHLLGCSTPKLMMNPHLTSADSTSWTSPHRWKKSQLFDGQEFKSFDKDWGTFVKNIDRHRRLITTYHQVAKAKHGVDHRFNERDIAAATIACWYKRMEFTINKQYYGGKA